MRTTAIVLAAGQGKRMGSDVAKQYMLLAGKPVLYYSLKNFEDSVVDEVILVAGSGETAYCREQIVEAYGFSKVRAIVSGGKERYHSVAAGLKAAAGLRDAAEQETPGLREAAEQETADPGGGPGGAHAHYVFIHDGARPFATPDIIAAGLQAVQKYEACVVGMPAKDTVKISDPEGFAADTPNRSLVWQVQTPQIFSFPLIYDAYQKLLEKEAELCKKGIAVTDDAMVAELFSGKKVKLVEGSYQNIKLTTPEDLVIAECFLKG